ncbi:RNA polymerase sigma factor [Frigoriglobus tundricola]|uniref:RNA polymerase sigma-70 region 2 domain-containing protein n=1 Tax=Frigoriglobus tundricola TaxID=2774151 RepID=A0A6M5Z0H2_9BACT|nr:sigma factor [Frigoriglobus tundricola]QJW99887.1 hypothetical protein FTUN_7510 [Frigoriglobus tundricola]
MIGHTGGVVLRAARAAASGTGAGTAATDRALLARFAGGDQAAFTALVERHMGMVLGVCRRALPNPHDADDACQAVFLVLARRAEGALGRIGGELAVRHRPQSRRERRPRRRPARPARGPSRATGAGVAP